MDYREQCGEKVSRESWVMRDIWQTYGMDYEAKFGLAANPKKRESAAVKMIIERGLWDQGIRKPLPEGAKHHEWKAAHGFRKYFKTKAEQVMLQLHVEMLLGHDTGLSLSYYRPTEKIIMKVLNLTLSQYCPEVSAFNNHFFSFCDFLHSDILAINSLIIFCCCNTKSMNNDSCE